MRGLPVFISDIRNCQNKEHERLRVDKEHGNIRTRFKTEKPYAAAKARVYLDKPAIHETMVKVSAYILGEFGHLHTLLPFLFFSQHMLKFLCTLNQQTLSYRIRYGAIFKKYDAVEYFALSRKGAALMDILAEMPKFPERQSALIKKKAEDTEVDTTEQIQAVMCVKSLSAIVPAGEQADSMQPIGNTGERFCSLCLKDSGVLYEDPYIQIGVEAEWRAHHGHLVLFLGNKNTSPLISVQSLVLPPAHLKMELSLVPETIPPRSQVQCPLKIINLHPSRDVAVLDFSYKFDNNMLMSRTRLFLQTGQRQTSPSSFCVFTNSVLSELIQFVRGVRPLPLLELANLFNSYHLTSCPGLDPNPNNLVASITFHSESTSAMLCLTTELRMTVASGYAYTYARTSNDSTSQHS
uniref:Clathrin adaptor alpha/beta/gamma-adaptin appendage Ig-like subdomain domain-containing protein n=1 Tax=Glycine max TaxID=3847 RepID=K7LTR0_SOYBN